MTELSLTFKRLVRGWGTNHIVALYALIGSAWILLSDRIVVFSAPDPSAAAIFSTVKGLGYVAVTAALLHWLINRHTAALRESEARFRIIFEHANDAIHIDNARDEILDVNPRMCELMGYTRDELLQMRISDLQAPETRAAGNVIVTELTRHGDALFEGLNLHRSGRHIPVEISVARVARLHGDLYVSVIRDITERKRREREIEAIAAIAMALRAASTQADMMPVIVHQVYNLLDVDSAVLILREPVTGENVIVYRLGIGADSTGLRIPRGSGIVGYVMSTGHPYLTQDAEHDPHTYRPDLLVELCAIGCAPLLAQDQVVGALWIGRTTAITDEEVRMLTAIGDIAANALHRAEVLETLEQRVYDRTRELAEANARLTELDRLKSKFVSDVSHELRTPITSLMLNVELLEHGKPEKREHYLHIIRQQTARQVQLIEDILNLSRLELSTAKLKFAPVDVNALIEQAVGVYRSSAEAANLNLTFTPDPNQSVVLGVESHLSQVVTNLIANAINYTPAGSVDVVTKLDGDAVLIEVRDTGLGIAPEDMPHLFDRFYRGKLTWQVRGSGLGLAIVKEIAEVHQGRVEVDSQAGVGSTFRVYLPLVK